MMRKLEARRIALGVAAAGIVTAGVAVALRSLASARRRRRHLQTREIVELRSVWVVVNGCRMHARVHERASPASSLPVVLVHGFGVSSSYFVPAAERLAREFSVYAVDLPGHGKSDTPGKPADVAQLADYLLRWIDAMGLERVSLIGNSMGCQICIDVAVRYPERFDRIVLAGPTADRAGRNVLEHARRLIIDGAYERVSLNPLLVVDYARMNWRLIPELSAMLRDRIEEKLPYVQVPVMLIRGEKDPIVPQRWLDEIAHLVRAERVVNIPRWGHAVHYSAAWQFVDAVAPFLRKTSPSAPNWDLEANH